MSNFRKTAKCNSRIYYLPLVDHQMEIINPQNEDQLAVDFLENSLNNLEKMVSVIEYYSMTCGNAIYFSIIPINDVEKTWIQIIEILKPILLGLDKKCRDAHCGLENREEDTHCQACGKKL